MLRGLLLAALVTGCLRDDLVQCADGSACPIGLVCVATGCATTDELAACQGLGDGAACEVAGFDGTCADGVCVAAVCGDGRRDTSEPCEGADVGGATCASAGFYAGELACTPTCELDTTGCSGRCGDGVVDAEEQCEETATTSCVDLGFSIGRPGCRADCNFDPAPCRKYGWRTITTNPQPFVDAFATSDGYFAVDANGDIIRYEAGQPPQRWPNANSRRFHAIAGSSASDVYTVSSNMVQHFDGTTWSDVTDTGLTSFSAIAVASPTRVILKGAAAGFHEIAVFDGSSWTRGPRPPQDMLSLAATATGMWGVDSDNIWFSDGGAWRLVTPGTAVSDVASSGDAVVAVGDEVLHWNGVSFVPVPGLVGVAWVTGLGAGRFLAGGPLRTIYEFDGKVWGQVRGPSTVSTEPLAGARVTSDGRLSVVGGHAIYESDLRLVDVLAGRLLWAFEAAIWDLRIPNLRRNGVSIAAATQLSDAWGTVDGNNGDVLFVARGGGTALDVLRCTRDGCVGIGGTGARKLSGSSTTDVWAIVVSSTYEIHHYDGLTWSITPLPDGVNNVEDIVAVAPDDVYAVGLAGTVLHFDGTSWSRLQTPASDQALLNQVIAFPGGRAIVAGSGPILELANGIWTEAYETTGTIQVIAGTSPDDVFIVGSQTLLRRDVHGWQPAEPPDLAGASVAMGLTSRALYISGFETYTRIEPRP